jgi:hypothetical protein
MKKEIDLDTLGLYGNMSYPDYVEEVLKNKPVTAQSKQKKETTTKNTTTETSGVGESVQEKKGSDYMFFGYNIMITSLVLMIGVLIYKYKKG